MESFLPGHPAESLIPIARQIITTDLCLFRRGNTTGYVLIKRIEENGAPPIIEVAELDASEALHAFYRLPQRMADPVKAFPSFRAVLEGGAP